MPDLICSYGRTDDPGAPCNEPATVLLVGPSGIGIVRYCRSHGESVAIEYMEILGEVWTLLEVPYG